MRQLKEIFSNIKYIALIASKYERLYLPLLIAVSLIQGTLPFANIIIPKYIINELTGSKRVDHLLLLVLILVGINLILRITNEYISTIYIQVADDHLQNRVGMLMGYKIMDIDYNYLENPEIYDMKEKANRINNGVIKDIVAAASSILSNVITLVGIIYIMAKLNPLIMLLILGTVTISARSNMKTQKLFYTIQNLLIPINRRLSYLFRMINDFTYGKDIRLFNLAGWLTKKCEYYWHKTVLEMKPRMVKVAHTNSIAIIVRFIQEGIVYIYLGLRVIWANMTLGDFVMYQNAVRSFTDSLSAIASAFVAIYQNNMYVRDYRNFMALENRINVDRDDTVPLPDLSKPYEIEFKDVSFKYPGQNSYALKNLSLTIKSGQKLSIVGLNGAGKTTLVKLLIRLYDQCEGVVLLNGTDIRKFNYNDYLSQFTVVFQDFNIFAFSLKENIALTESEKCDDERLISAIEKSGLDEKVRSLEKGMDSQIYKIFDEHGIELSGGEKQKLALARALYRKSSIVVLDEPTSALDPLAEYDLYKRFADLTEGRTTLYISHRMSSSKFSDAVAVIKNGTMVEYGTHEELMRRNGDYTTMFEAQAQYYI
ncbi:ABC transporter ATP-binding protein [Mahella australiensis]|uniref:ABC transporter related protein n=1 Tax=Mahella australiensis (strain DSM 15567 / CIP 107919 / 50-1 BON) TaxID=697281 RepID=F3ZYT7_MAHA5|nr:ABC transporter ATP-binding protein [Mahella australiensis]AEE95682.1 ABC transporter related protein [Mahella australiensis 50-1 BON]